MNDAANPRLAAGAALPAGDESTETAGRAVTTGTPNGYTPWVTTPFFPSYATIQSAGDAYKSVLSDIDPKERASAARD